MRKLAIGLLMFVLGGCATTSSDKPADEISAGMDKEAIRKAIRDHLIPIRHCYEKELKVKPKLSGKLVLEWDVEDKGKVTRVVVKKSADPEVDHCIAEVIKGVKFPEPPKGQIGRIAFPFEFKSE
jgi:TonB family protein